MKKRVKLEKGKMAEKVIIIGSGFGGLGAAEYDETATKKKKTNEIGAQGFQRFIPTQGTPLAFRLRKQLEVSGAGLPTELSAGWSAIRGPTVRSENFLDRVRESRSSAP